MNRYLLILTLCLTIYGCSDEPAYGGNCNLLVRHSYGHAVVQQVVAYPQVYYAAGADIQADALAEKVSQKVLKLVQQQLTQQQKAAPASEPITRPTTNAFAKCASCHTGANAAGGLVLDGVTAIECRTYAQWGKIAGQGKNVPQQMRALMGAMSDAEKGAINNALLDLLEPTPAQPEGDLE